MDKWNYRKIRFCLAVLLTAGINAYALSSGMPAVPGSQEPRQGAAATSTSPAVAEASGTSDRGATSNTSGAADRQPAEPSAGASDNAVTSGGARRSDPARASGGPAADANATLREAASVVKEMEQEPQLRRLMQQAKGIFIMPDYARGGLGVGVRGGEGVMMANNQGTWSSPAFYNLGGVSVGVLGGAEVGRVAMLLMTDKAVRNFMQDDKFALDADAGLTLVNFTGKASANLGRGDVIVWTDTWGAFASAAVGATDISFDNEENAAFYRPGVTAREIITGKVTSRKADALTAAMPKPSGSATGASTGASGGEVSTDDPGAPESIEAK